MPTYDFECTECGHSNTDFDEIRGDRIKTCPSCGRSSFVRLIGVGSGFINNSGFRDLAGQSVHFKEPYFDTAMRRSFSSAREKAEFMRMHKIVEAGDSDVKVKRERKEHHEKTMDTKEKKR